MRVHLRQWRRPSRQPAAGTAAATAARHRRATVVVLAIAALAAGCGAKEPQSPEHAPVNMQLLAVLPLEPAPAPSADSKATPPPPDAGMAVTAQIYRVLAEQTEFRFVPDLTVSDVLDTPGVRRAGGVVERAVALGKEVGADGVIFGRVFRFQKRVGTAFGVSQPASVWFEIGLVAVSSGDIVWRGRFDQTQEPLSSNLLDWWIFWGAGPRWISSSELAGLGVDRLFRDLTAAVNTEG